MSHDLIFGEDRGEILGNKLCLLVVFGNDKHDFLFVLALVVKADIKGFGYSGEEHDQCENRHEKYRRAYERLVFKEIFKLVFENRKKLFHILPLLKFRRPHIQRKCR